jgi:chaperonin GroEL (HSP60 family)
MISELRAQHDKENLWVGVDVFNSKVGDMKKADVYEPLSVKKQILKSATEAATMILKIDDVIASGKAKMPAGPPRGPGGMGGMGGMPPPGGGEF